MKPQFKLRRYHNKVFLPDNIGIMCVDFIRQLPFVDITHHGAEELLRDKRGVIPLPSKEELFDSRNTLVEIYERLDRFGNPTGIIQKAVIRVHNLNDKFDYTYVIAREGFIVSAWSNSKSDSHRIIESFNNYYCPHSIKETVRAKLEADASNYVQVDNL